jgi:hypothetical protein
MRKALFLSVLFGLLLPIMAFLASSSYAQDKSENQSKKGYGMIEGQVVTMEGVPVANATVYAFEYGRSLINITDVQGKFTLTHVPVGEHRIIAYKEGDGFPNLLWSFYSEAYKREEFPTINVEENQPVRGVIVRLGPKAGRLLIRVIDAKTRQPIRDASVALNHKGKPKTLFRSGTTMPDSKFDLLIPPSIPINVVISAPGYKTWRFVNAESVDRDAVRVQSGSSRKIIVELRPVK